MPTPATNHLTINTLLDLLGQASTLQASGNERGAFDALLQASAAPPRQHEESLGTKPGGKTYREEEHAFRNEETERAASTGAAESSPAKDAVENQDREDEVEEREFPADGPIDEVVEEIAQEISVIIAAAAASTPTADLPVESEESSEDGTTGGLSALAGEGDERIGRRAAKKAGAPESDLPVGATVAAARAVEETRPDKQLPEGQQKTLTTAFTPSAGNGTETIQNSEAGTSNSQFTEDVTALDLPDAGELERQEALNAQADPEHTSEPSGVLPDALAADKQSIRSEVTTVDSNKGRPAEALPVAAPTQAPPASAQVAASATEPTAAIAGAAVPKRSRLPAEMLTHAPAAAKPRATVEVHSERLLARVARALAAAEAREGEVRLRLSPPELGSLRLELKVHDGAMIAHVEAETETARTAIVDNLPALRERLAEQGVRIERFEVDLMQRHAGGAPNQSDQRQSNESQGGLRVALPPRRAAEAGVLAPVASPATGSGASGLNVIV